MNDAAFLNQFCVDTMQTVCLFGAPGGGSYRVLLRLSRGAVAGGSIVVA
ncbi:hypothetical protein RSSM_05264 [Rhodopirellula sallentina SM41]|uniref:Uncharacterized protein n=1 Tax=Rhodopirellula sallentina SM41 TaxID=1263870 RepID=M5U612_9BACT|nr:hypothetical protein RSSM_05264 [Rhodopirellula sallentina SM41]